MNIMLYGNGEQNDGTGRLLTSLRDRLQATGEDVTFQLRGAPKGILPKLRWMLRGLFSDALEAARADVIVVHTALSLNVPLLMWARVLRKPTVAFVWDIYPASTKESGQIKNQILLWIYSLTEGFGYYLCTRLLIPTKDYLPALPPRFRGKTDEFPMWVTDSVRELESKQELSPSRPVVLAFAGQLNSIRSIDDAMRELLAVYGDARFELQVFSADELPKSLIALSQHADRLSVVHRGYHAPKVLADLLAEADFGLVALNQNFVLPAFPSKIMTYIAVGLPVLYSGPASQGIVSFLEDAGLGVHVRGELQSAQELGDVQKAYPLARQRYLTHERERFRDFLQLLSPRSKVR